MKIPLILLGLSVIMLIIAVVMGIFSVFEMRGCIRNLEGQQELSKLINKTYNSDGTRKEVLL